MEERWRARQETLCGLHQLAAFVTHDPDWSPPMGGRMCQSYYVASQVSFRRETKTVLGCWDPSARKFFKTDELS